MPSSSATPTLQPVYVHVAAQGFVPSQARKSKFHFRKREATTSSLITAANCIGIRLWEIYDMKIKDVNKTNK
jgi:hypothetical protein